ncbi:MAG: Rpn family recombination-promoting nuclease/putative transposase [Eubacteriales bacterium]|nr:Rpn family recombination-promoting nuclease/putative transposase [Eubacteriales bacterium]
MADKDIVEKTLEAYSDVFADIVNVLLFDGSPVVREDELAAAAPRSHYKADGRLREQERDIVKWWKSGNVRLALYGVENQTEIDRDMPLRVIGYDGIAYRTQLLETKAAGETAKRYPVVTLVLYFGRNQWKHPKRLAECMDIPEELTVCFNDYKLNLFEIAYLEQEQVEKFQSDFRIVADYFVQMRKNHTYQPPGQTIRHVQEVLELMTVLTGDQRFEEAGNQPQGRSVTNMCEVLDRVEERGIQRGRQKGRQEGRKEGRQAALLESMRNLMKSLNLTAEQAMDALMIPQNERGEYRESLGGK